MSSLYKLSVSGVRAFSPKDQETIQFGLPLTLICGQNGCGKTTVIEALKYATTGDLPPNSKGGAFVNDPTIADRLVVNAEVKLGFISVDGKQMTVTRNMQLNRKKVHGLDKAGAANTFKTLEGQLAVFVQGHKTALSTKNAELDVRVPQYLGALRAVLEYVIFCHQDDSLWPLSEASVLKKRFDEIFEALRFTKVLDTLKGLRKDMAADLKLVQQAVQHAKVNKLRAAKLRVRVGECVATSDRLTGEIQALTLQIEQVEAAADRLFRSNQEFQRTMSEHQRLTLLVESSEAAVRRLELGMALLPDLDAALQGMAANFDSVRRQKETQLLQLALRLQKVKGNQQRAQDQLQRLVRDEGTLLAKAAAHTANVARLEAASHTDSALYAAESKERAQNLRQDLARLKLDNSREVQALQSAVSSAHEAVTREKEHWHYSDRETEQTAAKIAELRQKVARAEALDALDTEQAQLESLRSRLARKSGPASLAGLEAAIAEKTAALQAVDAELDDLMRRIAAASKHNEARARLDLLKEALEVKSAVHTKAVAQHGPEFLALTETALGAGAEVALDQKVVSVKDQLTGILAAWGACQKRHDLLGHKLTAAQGQRDAAQRTIANHKARITAVLSEAEIPEYEKIAAEMEEDYKTAVYNLNTYEVTSSYKAKAVELAKLQKCCALCLRGMTLEEVEVFSNEIKASIEVATKEQFEKDVQLTLEDLDALKAVHVDVVQLRKAQPEAETLELTIRQLEADLAAAQHELEELETQKTNCQAQLDALERLAKSVASIFRQETEIGDIKKQIADSSLEFLALEGTQSLAELQKAQQRKTLEAKAVRQEIATAKDDLAAEKSEIAKLESQIKDKQLQISRLELAMNEATAARASIAELELHSRALVEKKAKIAESCKELEAAHQAKKTELEETMAKCKALESQLEAQVADAETAASAAETLHQQIQSFESTDLPKINHNKEQLKLTRQQIEDALLSRTKLEEEVQAVNQFLSDASGSERNVRDNLEYRALTAELEGQREALAALDLANAEAEKAKYQEQLKKYREEIAELNLQHYGKVGEVKQINDQVLALKRELETEFKDADKHYHEEWLKLQTNLLVVTDLQTYSQALDKSIMEYHSMKMDEINRILRDLWNQTYKGTDIDGVEIKCEQATLGRGRSYNYRVVMYKKSSELDMRGRCSAGQKVLTSILIRLALAECFGTNCGMIALDEPTTNLDAENAESLANALNNIIDFRKSQKNFQLIVITHDEKFLSHINGDRYTDNFYRIERDENQHSIIKSLPIHLMQDD